MTPAGHPIEVDIQVQDLRLAVSVTKWATAWWFS